MENLLTHISFEMLIPKLDSIRQNLASKRMFLAAKHTTAGGAFFKGYYRFVVGDLALIECKLSWILVRLSYLCSSLRSLLINWNDHPKQMDEWKRDIRFILDEISIPDDVAKLIGDNKSIRKLDRLFLKNSILSERIIGEMYARNLPMKRYAGATPELVDEPKITLKEVLDTLASIKSVNLLDRDSIKHTINEIGKEASIEFQQAWADRYSSRRLN
jgi:hypothetical protein